MVDPVTVRGVVRGSSGNPSPGVELTFTQRPRRVLDAATGSFYYLPTQAMTDAAGAFTASLVPSGTSVPLNPAGWSYSAVLRLDGKIVDAFDFVLPTGGTSFELADLVAADPSVGAFETIVGPSGPSAFEVAAAAGFVGTQAQWLASLTGPKGGDGPAGPAGTTDYTLLTNRPDLAGTYAALAKLGTTTPTLVADGATDDAPAINAAVAAVNAAGGGRVVLPPGIIRLATPIIPKNNVIVQGAGRGRTILKPLQHGFEFSTGTQAAPLTNFHLRDLAVDGTDRSGVKTWKGYHGQYHKRCTWENLYISNTGQTGLGPDFLNQCVISNCVTENTGLENDGTMPSGNGIGIGMGQALVPEPFLIVGCTAINAKRFGIMIEGGAGNVGGAKIIGCTATGSEAGINVAGGSGAIITGNYAYANVGHGFKIGTATLASSLAGQRGLCNNNVAENNGASGFCYDATIHAPVGPGFEFAGNTSAGNTDHGFYVITTGNNLQHVVVARNYIARNGASGIHLEANDTTTKLIGCRFDDNTLSENLQTGGQNYQIRVRIDMDYCSISGNLLYYTGASAAPWIYVGYSGHPDALTNCVIKNNVTNLATFLQRYTAVTLPGTEISGNRGGELTATLAGGTATVADTAITANSIIRLAAKTIGGTPGAVYVSAKTAGTGFTITSTSASDTSVIAYEVIRY